jgi:catechol 2,3-dioxygenase-like lactoylglutathione lyase family enzyme
VAETDAGVNYESQSNRRENGDILSVSALEERTRMNPRISMITLGVRDLAASVSFYEEGLGFPRMESPPEVAFFTLNGTWLGLYGRDALAADASVSSQGEGFESFALAHNLHSEAEVDQVIIQAVEAGATLVKKPQKVFWGGYSGYFKDPDGHLWEIAHNPLFWVGPQDSGARQG